MKIIGPHKRNYTYSYIYKTKFHEKQKLVLVYNKRTFNKKLTLVVKEP